MCAYLGKTSTGKPNIWTTGCSSTVSDVRVKFHGGASWLYNVFSKAIENNLKKALKKQVVLPHLLCFPFQKQIC